PRAGPVSVLFLRALELKLAARGLELPKAVVSNDRGGGRQRLALLQALQTRLRDLHGHLDGQARRDREGRVAQRQEPLLGGAELDLLCGFQAQSSLTRATRLDRAAERDPDLALLDGRLLRDDRDAEGGGRREGAGKRAGDSRAQRTGVLGQSELGSSPGRE